ncbi:MAG: glycosyltransferase [Bacteroidales bacterium]|nr:glycosyltransferase [Bacteroidales bacterium]
MSFADTYFRRFQTYDKIISEEPNKDIFLSVVIPSYNEPDLCTSLQSLLDCELPKQSVEVIVVVNSSEDTPEDILNINRESYSQAKEFSVKYSTERLNFRILNFDYLPKKFAGVGLARKIGMDEALHRFDFLNKNNGLIAGFDADALVQNNYFTEIEKHFRNNPATKACSINFEHPIEGNQFNENIYKNIINYELHLRYFVEALRYAKFPYAYHTIGSSFVVRADIYAVQGGMNRKKAGEDFYFLQKIIPLGNYSELNSTAVIPSPRMSDRVPFGTGAAVKKMIEQNKNDFTTYNFEVFEILKHFFEGKDKFYEEYSTDNVNVYISEFLEANNFKEDLAKIKDNSPNINIFRKRFYDWFNAFRIIKFLNYTREKYFTGLSVKQEAEKLLQRKYSSVFIPESEKEMLLFYRDIQKRHLYNTGF